MKPLLILFVLSILAFPVHAGERLQVTKLKDGTLVITNKRPPLALPRTPTLSPPPPIVSSSPSLETFLADLPADDIWASDHWPRLPTPDKR